MRNKALVILLGFLLVLFSSVVRSDSVDSSDGGIDVLKNEFTEDNGNVYRVDYSAHNGRSVPVYFKIYLTQCDNCYDGLITGNTIIDPGETINAGSVQRADPNSAWNITYKWNWTEAVNQ